MRLDALGFLIFFPTFIFDHNRCSLSQEYFQTFFYSSFSHLFNMIASNRSGGRLSDVQPSSSLNCVGSPLKEISAWSLEATEKRLNLMSSCTLSTLAVIVSATSPPCLAWEVLFPRPGEWTNFLSFGHIFIYENYIL